MTSEGRAQPHPQRCETCKGPCQVLTGSFFNDRLHREPELARFTELVGCASHSTSSQQQIPEPCKGCTDPNQCYVPCSGASSQQRIEQAIIQLEGALTYNKCSSSLSVEHSIKNAIALLQAGRK